MASYGAEVDCGARIDAPMRALLSDPQTSGGLLVACSSDAVDDVLKIFRAEGFAHAAVIGECVAGAARVEVA